MSGPVEFDLVLRSEIEIARAPAIVWPFLNRLREWKDSVVSVEHLAGASDTEGELQRIGQRPTGETVYVLHKTLRVRIPRWRVQTLNTEDGVSTNGYIIYSLADHGGVTLLTCDVAARVRLTAPVPAVGVEQIARAANEATQAKLDADHKTLKRLVEEAS